MKVSGLECISVLCPFPDCVEGLDASSSDENSRCELVDGENGRFFRKYVYVKPHGGNVEDGADTAFVANVGVTWSDEDIVKLFSSCGKVAGVARGVANMCHFARVTFASSKGLKKLMSLGGKKKALEFGKGAEGRDDVEDGRKSGTKLVGLEEYQAERPGLDVLKQETEEYMKKFHEFEEEERRREMEKQADDDGFTVVKYRKSSRGVGPEGDANEPPRKKKKKELKNFYRFQMREEKRDKLLELRKKFEEDKLHIQRLKDSRKFKPFK
uniref:Ribosomal RNA-processing protein 7 C-terminal domain-containing protein n=1 Tax=Mucochytrium quahogii TaxID=96639 RepID=A0A7S2S2W7_9STRA|mmetsp:Transcript_23897/g.52007  ORF Transcript_23897/g.52007 Transcript_23897/m.52007 type:complete len:269 (+) Transcript_23897:124-930(+)